MQHEFKPEIPTLFLGIGNPGEEYTHTFHNIGLLFIAYMTQYAELTTVSKKHFLFKKYSHAYAVASSTYMNESGLAAQESLSYFSLSPQSLVLIHDDSDMYIGEYKIQKNAGSAGHKGVASVIQSIGTQDFYRIRIGIRPKQFFFSKRKKAGDFVLSRISQKEEGVFENVFQKIISELSPEFLPDSLRALN